MKNHLFEIQGLMLIALTFGSNLTTAQEAMMDGGMTNALEIPRPKDGDWARAKIEAADGKGGLKAGQRQFLQRLKSDPEFAANWNRQVEENLTKIRTKPELVKPAIDQREHKHDIQLIHVAAKKIDQIIFTKLKSEGKTFNPKSSDKEFVRRIYILAAGRIPTHAETLAFLEDNSLAKRANLIDDLLLRPDYRLQMFNYFTDMMRIKEMHPLKGDSAGYQHWMMQQLAINRGWDEIVYELLSAQGTLVTNPAVGWMIRDQGMDLDRLANTMTTFMGAAVGCAQCHDHPSEDWTQKQFYELTSFFGSLKIPGYGAKGFGSSRESKSTAAVSIAYVMNDDDRFLTYPEDWAYTDADPGAKVIAKFPTYENLITSRELDDPKQHQQVFARWMTHPHNGQFAATIANRLWRKAFGSGVIEPIDELDDIDAASNPELMRYLAKMIRQVDFDMMAFQRVIYNTQAFQAEASLTPPQGFRYQFQGPIMRRMLAEQVWDSFVTLRYGETVNDHIRPRDLEARQYDVFEPGALAKLEYPGNVANKASYVPLLEEAAKLRLKHKGEWMKALKKTTGFKRASELRLPAPESHFLRQYGQSAKLMADKGTREGTIPQALMMMNGQELQRQVFSNPQSHFYQLAAKHSSSGAQIDSLYLSFLGRHATDDEKRIISRNDLPISEIAWILANTREFIFVQ
ncbi:MAG: DUF1549 domain-containing protein [Verrucomicrobiota bacterium]